MVLAIVAWGASLIIMSAVGTYAIIQGQQVNQRLCEVSNDNRVILKNMLELAKRQALEGATDVLDRNLIRQRYNELVALVPPLDCTKHGGPQELEQ